MSTFDVRAVIQGNSVNEVASKLMTSAYIGDFELDELDIQLRREPEKVLLWEDVNQALTSITNPVDNEPGETFHFPRTQQLVEDLNKRGKNGTD